MGVMKAFKVMSQGGSLRVTLPKEWTTENNVMEGDNVIVASSESVVIFCKDENMSSEKRDRIQREIRATLELINQIRSAGRWPPK